MNTIPIKNIDNEPKKWYTVYTWPRIEKKVSVPEKRILYLNTLLKNGGEIEETGYTLALGSKIIINTDPQIVVEGKLVELTNKKRVVIRLSEIQKSIKKMFRCAIWN